MALSENMRQIITQEMLNDPSFANEKPELLIKIVQIACQHDLRLEFSHRPTKEILLRELPQYRHISLDEIEARAQDIFQKIQHAHQSQNIASLYSSRGNFSSKFIHQRGAHEWLQDHDISYLMPKSTPTIAVLASMDTNLPEPSDLNTFTEGLKISLQNSKIQHIMFPIGPNHWRGAYLSKPTKTQPHYILEIFDSFGAQSAQTILKPILQILQNCGIASDSLQLKFTSPPVLQGDAYSCGDFTCAHSHKKMLDFGTPTHQVNFDLVNALEQGNAQHQLRKTVCHQFIRQSSVDKHVHEILSIKQTLFERAQDALEKQKANKPLTDEEYATILQVEEIKKLSPK